MIKASAYISAAILIMVSGGAYAQTTTGAATANTATAEVKPAPASIANRSYGKFSAGTVDKVTYSITPTCPEFVFDMKLGDLEALDVFYSDKSKEAKAKQTLLSEEKRLDTIRAQWKEYESCLTNNTKADSSALVDIISKPLGETANLEVKAHNDLVASMNQAAARLPAIIKKRKPDSPPDAPFVSKWKDPTGRFVGSVTGGTVIEMSYSNACPLYDSEITAADIEATHTSERYAALADVVNGANARLQATAKCRQENAVQDLNTLNNAIIAGFNAYFNPIAKTYTNKLNAAYKVFDTAHKQGHILANVASPASNFDASAAPKPAAKPAPAAKPKKK